MKATPKTVNAALKAIGAKERLYAHHGGRSHYFADGEALSWYTSTLQFHLGSSSVEEVVAAFFRMKAEYGETK